MGCSMVCLAWLWVSSSSTISSCMDKNGIHLPGSAGPRQGPDLHHLDVHPGLQGMWIWLNTVIRWLLLWARNMRRRPARPPEEPHLKARAKRESALARNL